MRKTKILCTIGPSTESPEMLEKMVSAGMNIVRLNFSHGSHESHGRIIKRIQKMNKKLDVSIAVLMDTQGPEIRTTNVATESLLLRRGDKVKIGFDHPSVTLSDNEHIIGMNYKNIVRDVNKGGVLLLDSGLIEIKINRKDADFLYGSVLHDGVLRSKKHVNLPGSKLHTSTLTEKDKQDILFATQLGVDFIALSFTRHPDDIRALKRFLLKNKRTARIIAKIEHPEAVKHLHDIVSEADGIMIARGDLAIEVPFEEIPILQKRIVKKCIEEGKPVIVATQLLESMVNSPFPTRAEITDISNAVLERADALMLSGETTTGHFPLKCVETMNKIIVRTEEELLSNILHHRVDIGVREEIARSACMLANNIRAAAILVFTRSGRTALNVSNFRPKPRVFGISRHPESCRVMDLYWGIRPCFLDASHDPEKTIQAAISYLKKRKLLYKDDKIIIISNILAGTEKVEAIQMRIVK